MDLKRLLEKRQLVFLSVTIIILVVIISSYFLYKLSGPRFPERGEELSEEEKIDVLNYLSSQRDKPNTPLSEKQRKIEELVSKRLEKEAEGYQYSEEGKLQLLRELQINK